MSELSFTNIQAASSCPDDSFIISEGKLLLDIGTAIGESVSSLSSEKVTELLYKLLVYTKEAQDAFNNNNGVPLPAGSRIDIVSPVSSSSMVTVGGNQYIPVSVSLRARLLINPNEVSSAIV